VAEVRVTGTGRHDQVVVTGIRAVGEHHPVICRIDRLHFAEEHLGIGLVSQYRADRGRDVAGVQRGCRHLVEHRLEEVVIPAVDQGYANGRALEGLRRIQAGEATPQDQDVGLPRIFALFTVHCSPLTFQSPIVSRRQRAKRTTSSTGGTASSFPYAVYIRHRR
jgi:hypothetical protein